MEKHPLDRPIASAKSFDVLQRVLEERRGEVKGVTTPLDSTNQRLHSGCVFDAYVADRPAIRESHQGEGFRRFLGEG